MTSNSDREHGPENREAGTARELNGSAAFDARIVLDTDPTLCGPVLEHAFDLRLDFDKRVRFGPICGGGEVGFVAVAGGTVEGPLLNGRVVPYSGGDYAYIRPDGVIEFNAHYLLEASDGTLIYLNNRGYGQRTRGTGSLHKKRIEPSDDPYYFRVTPVFRAPLGPHDWLTRTVILGAAERRENPDRTLFRYYAVL